MASITDIKIVDYSEKSIAVYGDTKKYKDDLKKMGGLFNMRLKEGPGWIFSKNLKSNIEKFINENVVTISEKKDYKKSSQTVQSTISISNSSDIKSMLTTLKTQVSQIQTLISQIETLVYSSSSCSTTQTITQTDDDNNSEIYEYDSDDNNKPRKSLLKK